MNRYNFGPAAVGENIVFGARRPGESHTVSAEEVYAWVHFMQSQGIRRVCCLLAVEQMRYYPMGLLDTYRQAFGAGNVTWTPVRDFSLASSALKTDILPFLVESDRKAEKVVVHCSGGIGRTGHVLAAWLVHGRNYTPEQALLAVTQTPAQRDPFEAVHSGSAALEELLVLLKAAQS